MKRTVAIGVQDFRTLIEKNYFYVDKTHFIKEWWEKGDSVTLITRPRRFGKTLNMSMLDTFFSIRHAGCGYVFANLDIWKEESYRKIQGTYPVISLSFANIKATMYESARHAICQVLSDLYSQYEFLLNENVLFEKEAAYFKRIDDDMAESDAVIALHRLSAYLSRYYGKKVIILLDEYDTPMQEAYVHGYWEDLEAFTRSMFNAAFKTNPYLDRAILTGITRVSKESIFSDLNHLNVVTTTSEEYADSFGFTEEEVFTAMDEQGMEDKLAVKKWYDGFAFGDSKDIYNPWSIINLLDTRQVGLYWANTSSNSLVGKLIREGSRSIKQTFERLMRGECIESPIDEQIVYSQLDGSESAILSLLLASGYLKVLSVQSYLDMEAGQPPLYKLNLTNYEVQLMFRNMVTGWFARAGSDYNDFVKALLQGELEAMNGYMNRVTASVFSSFDTQNREPERFYHGFVLGLLVELSGRYVLTSNRESGFGRYDVMLEPQNKKDDAIIIEFKVRSKKEKSLEETAEKALKQIEARQYEQKLRDSGVPAGRIRKYGFAFEGREVLIIDSI